MSLLIVSSVALAATGDVEGKILDKITKEPVPGATVIWLGADEKILKGTVTDIDGHFQLVDMETGEQQLLVRYLGFASKTITISVSPEGNADLSIELENSMLDLSAIEILGTSSGSIRKNTGTYTKLSAKKINEIQPMGTQEILEYVPGINGFSDDGMGNSRISIGIRGLNPRRSSRVLILEDGIPIQPAIYLYPNMYYNPPMERIDEIEVIKGSGAIKHGPQTMGGIINYISKRPRKDFGGTAQIIGGTNNYRSVFASVGGWGNDKIHPELQLLYKSGDGYRDNNHFDQYNATFKVNAIINSKRSLYIKLNTNYENSNATYTGLTEYTFRTNPTFNPKKDDNFQVFRLSLDVIYENEINASLLSTTKVYANHFSRDWWRENDVFVRAEDYDVNNPVVPVAWYASGDLVRVGDGKSNLGILRSFYVGGVEQAYDYSHRIGKVRGNLETGARLHYERFIDDKKQGNSPTDREGVYFTGDPDSGNVVIVGQSHHYETTALAFFVQEKLLFGENFTLLPGVRYELFEQERIDRLDNSTYRDKTTGVVLPGFGFNYEMEAINLFGGVHRGFTPPSSGTLKVLNFGEDISKDGFDVAAEKSWNYEVGIRGNTKAVTFEIAGFLLSIEDMVAAGRGAVFENLGQVTMRGLESSIHIHLDQLKGKKKFLKFSPDIQISYTFLDASITQGEIPSSLSTEIVSLSGNSLPYAPEHSLVAGLSKDFGFGLGVSANVKYVSDVFTDFENIIWTENRGDQGVVPAYYIINANVNYRLNKSWKFFGSVKNLTDNIYIGSRLHSNRKQPNAAISSGILPGARRQINIGIRYNFGK
ncbi:MAG: TonB-dependent receptor [Flavobacteriales bacterium]|nr:TonB-dependent receptor [Flavobacteriales bacterium]